jgi:hypothetical protein
MEGGSGGEGIRFNLCNGVFDTNELQQQINKHNAGKLKQH